MVKTHRDLRLLSGAVLLSAAGDMLALLTLAIAVFDLTGSGVAVAGYFAATMVPAVALAPLAGLVADRVESVRALALASLAQAAIAVALAFALDDLTLLIALSALLAAGSAISQPAEFALVPVVARSHDLIRANGVVESARYAGFALGPVIAAGLAAAGDARLALLVNAASFVAIALAARGLHARRPPVPRTAGATSDRARDGIAALLADPIVRPTILAAVAALVVISAVHVLEVVYVAEVLHAGDHVYALLTAAWMAGMIAGATVLAPRVPNAVLAAAALVALAVQGAGIGLQAAWAVVPVAFLGYVVGGVGHGVKNTLLRTLLQRRIAERLHGRAFAAYNAARNTAELLALAGGGVLVTALGPRAALLVAGAGPVLAAALGLLALQLHRDEHHGRDGQQRARAGEPQHQAAA